MGAVDKKCCPTEPATPWPRRGVRVVATWRRAHNQRESSPATVVNLVCYSLCNRLRLVMANGDRKYRVDILLIKEALVLVGPERGLEFELGGKKFKVQGC